VCAVSAFAQAPTQTTNTEVKRFEVVSVNGNKVVVNGENGTQEITVPADFRLSVDGKPVAVHDLKPGMKGTATITTTTTVTPVYVTEVKNGEIMSKSGNSIIVKTAEGLKMFSEGDIEKRNIKIMKDGRVAKFTDLQVRDKLTATIVTEQPPKVATQRDVEAALSSNPPPARAAATNSAAVPTAGRAPAPAPRPAAPAAAAPAANSQAGAAPALPKTASSLPARGLLGVSLLGIGLLLTLRRRSA